LNSTPSTIDKAAPAATLHTRPRVWHALGRLVREPLLHFLLIGIALFVVYSLMHRGQTGVEPSHEIALSFDELRTMDLYFESQWHRQPTGEEFNAMVENKIQEEILYREGLTMGLDKDDTIVKRRMAQKLQFLAEDVASAHEPSTEELQAWFAKNSEKFALPSRATFRHLYFSFDKRGQKAHADADAALVKLSGQPGSTTLAATLADPFMFQDYYADKPPVELAKEFGPTFAVGVFKLKPRSWQGPIESGFGWHLVFVDSIIPGHIPAFEEIEPDVKTAWLGYQKGKAWREAYARMRARYSVLLPAAPDQPSAFPPAAPKKKEVPPPVSDVSAQ
jgi:peptidyl-prolyl cis-trans isomerase C